MQPVELVTKEAEHSFVDVVGHLTISNLEKTSQRNREKQRQQRNENPQQRSHLNRPKPYQKPNQNKSTHNKNKPPQKGK